MTISLSMANLAYCHPLCKTLICFLIFSLIVTLHLSSLKIWMPFCHWPTKGGRKLAKINHETYLFIYLFIFDWFTNLNWNGEWSGTKVFLYHVANPLCHTKQISHLLGTQVAETLHWTQRANKDIWRLDCQGTNANLIAQKEQCLTPCL